MVSVRCLQSAPNHWEYRAGFHRVPMTGAQLVPSRDAFHLTKRRARRFGSPRRQYRRLRVGLAFAARSLVGGCPQRTVVFPQLARSLATRPSLPLLRAASRELLETVTTLVDFCNRNDARTRTQNGLPSPPLEWTFERVALAGANLTRRARETGKHEDSEPRRTCLRGSEGPSKGATA